MPFDYNSFMQGVITGLKLGRTKLGRQPPVPSGMYILTESGEHVLTERVGSGLATFYPISKDPDDPSLFFADAYSGTGINDPVVYSNVLMQITHYDKDGNPPTEDTQIFFWIRKRYITSTLIQKSVYCVLLWENASADPDFYIYGAPSISENTPVIIPANYPSLIKQAGDFRYLPVSLEIEDTHSHDVYLRINNAVMFEGTEDELAGFVANLSGMPMITEGG